MPDQDPPKLPPLDVHVDVRAARAITITSAHAPATVILKGTPGRLLLPEVGRPHAPRFSVRFDICFGAGGATDQVVNVGPDDIEFADVPFIPAKSKPKRK